MTGAIRATFHTARPVPSRGVVSFVFDVPTEEASAALALLGGFPTGAESVWVGIVPLKPEAAAKPDPKARYAEASEGERAVVRSNIMTGDPAFQKWCAASSPKQAGEYIRQVCRVKSRADFATDPDALARFLAMEGRYRTETRFGPEATR